MFSFYKDMRYIYMFCMQIPYVFIVLSNVWKSKTTLFWLNYADLFFFYQINIHNKIWHFWSFFTFTLHPYLWSHLGNNVSYSIEQGADLLHAKPLCNIELEVQRGVLTCARFSPAVYISNHASPLRTARQCVSARDLLCARTSRKARASSWNPLIFPSITM